MTAHAALPTLASEFEPFLHARFAPETSGVPLSVLSALARRDLDPWDTAAMLARLPRVDAIGQLVALLDTPSGAAAATAGTEATAARLIDLLPRAVDRGRTAENAAPAVAPKQARTTIAVMVLYAIFMLLLQYSHASKPDVPARITDGRPAAAADGSPSPPAAKSGDSD